MKFALTLVIVLLCCVVTRAQVDDNHTYNPRVNDDRGALKTKLNSTNIRLRDDILWHTEAANVVYPLAGNLSVLSATRLGLSDRVEISTYLLEDVLRPTIYVKALWRVFKKNWFLSSRFDVANAYTGMKIGQKLEIERIISQTAEIPLVFELGHEIVISRAWYTDPNCSDGSCYMILTGGLGTYGSFKVNQAEDLSQLGFHFLANRGETLTGTGFRGRAKVWIDGRLTNRLYAHAGISYHFGSFMARNAVEIQAEGEYFLSSKSSFKLGILTSIAHYRSTIKHAGVWPILDYTYYFGSRKLRQGTLFQKGVYKGSKL